MTPLHWAFDAAVVILLLGLASRLLTTRDLFEAIVLFVAYGLTLALAWVRVGAPDIALAEAALGAGVTGALFLNAFHRLAHRVGAAPPGGEGGQAHPRGQASPGRQPPPGGHLSPRGAPPEPPPGRDEHAP